MPTMPRLLFEADQQVREAKTIIDGINTWIKPTPGSKDIIIFPDPMPESNQIIDPINKIIGPINKLKEQLFGRIAQIQGSLNSLNDVRQLYQGKENDVATALTFNLDGINAAVEKLKEIIKNLKDEVIKLDNISPYTVNDLNEKAKSSWEDFIGAIHGRDDGWKVSDFVLNDFQISLSMLCDLFKKDIERDMKADPINMRQIEWNKKTLEIFSAKLKIVDAEITYRKSIKKWNPTSSPIEMMDVPEPKQIAVANPVEQEDIVTMTPGTEKTPGEEEVNIRILFRQFEKARTAYHTGMRHQSTQETLNPFRDQMLKSATALLKYDEVSLKRVGKNEVKYLAMYIHCKEEINTLGVTQIIDYPPYEAYGLMSLKNRIADPTFTDKQKVEFLFGKFMAAKDNYEVNKNKPALNEFNKRRIVSFAESLLAFGEAKLREVDTKKTDELALNIYDKKIEGKIDSKVVDVTGGRCNVYGLAGFKDKISDPTQSIMARMISADTQSATIVAVSVNNQEPERSFLGDLKQKIGDKAVEIKGKAVGLRKKE